MAFNEALRAAFKPLWASDVTRSGMPIPRSLRPTRKPRQWTSASGATHSEDHALAVVAADAVGDEGGAIAHDAVDADFVVGGVDDQVRDLGQRAGAPFFELFVELFVEVGDLAGGYLEAAQLLHDPGDSAGANTFDIHGGDGGFEGTVAT